MFSSFSFSHPWHCIKRRGVEKRASWVVSYSLLLLEEASSEAAAFMATTNSGISDNGEEMNWVVDIQFQATAGNFDNEKEMWKKHSIYMIPSCIRGLNHRVYQPQVVSFGPYHHGEGDLAPMEVHKQRSLVHYLSRSGKSLKSFVKELKEVEPQLMGAYDGLDDKWRQDRGRFLQLMITDGCFMLEIMRYTDYFTASTDAVNPNSSDEPKFKDYDSTDPIFSAHGVLNVVPYIKRDMLMLENQLPLSVLAKLVAVETGKTTSVDETVNRTVLKFLAPGHPYEKMPLGHHALDVFRKCMVQGPAPKSVNSKKKQKAADADIIRSAMELNEAGIRFKKSDSKSLKDIRFKHGVLRLPELVVDDLTEYMLLNLMAFERIHVGAGNDVTSYVFFMDNIIDSAKDVSLLASKGIIQNALGSDKAVAHLFNSLSKDVTLDPKSPLDEVHGQVREYCGKSWNTWRANLLHTYFHNPWAFLSLAAAIFLLVLTVAQTVFTVLQWRQGFNEDSSPPPPPFLAPSVSPSPR